MSLWYTDCSSDTPIRSDYILSHIRWHDRCFWIHLRKWSVFILVGDPLYQLGLKDPMIISSFTEVCQDSFQGLETKRATDSQRTRWHSSFEILSYHCVRSVWTDQVWLCLITLSSLTKKLHLKIIIGVPESVPLDTSFDTKSRFEKSTF